MSSPRERPHNLRRYLSISGFSGRALSVKHAGQSACIVPMAISLAALAGWALEWPVLTRWLPASPAMVPETAAGLLLASITLWMAQKSAKGLVHSAGGILAPLGLVNLIGHSPLLAGGAGVLASAPFRMAQESAIAFLMLGIAAMLIPKLECSLWAQWTVAMLSIGLVVAGLFTGLMYLSGLTSAPWWGGFLLQMALPSAICFCALGVALASILFQQEGRTAYHFLVTAPAMSILGLLMLFAGVNAAVLASSTSLMNIRTEARRVSDEIRSIQALLDGVRKAESGQRGYLLTGERQYLLDFNRGEQSYYQAIREKKIKDSRLFETVSLKLGELRQTMELEEQGRHAEALAILKTSYGLRLMEQIDSRQRWITGEREKDIALKRDQGQRTILSIRQTVLWSYGMAVVFALATLLMIVAEMRRRSQIEAGLRETEARIHAELRDQTERAEDANRAKSSFLASMSHEIRTPMNAILGMADMLWETELTQTQRHYVEIFRRAGGTLLTLINDILNLSKIESGNFSLERVDFDLGEVVEQLLEILTPKAEAKGVALSAHIEAGTSASLIGDPVRLQQVLLNLLGNALKFTEKGSVSLLVRSHDTASHATLDFEVTDTGIGIAEDKRASIFEDFTQAESSITRRFGGTGLGLSISQRIVSLMGGKLEVRSQLGVGSTFYFSLAMPINSDHQKSRTAELVDVAGKRVLIVDNNSTNRAILGAMCSTWGMQVTTRESGAEAVEAVRNGNEGGTPFALALVDRMMPGMDGFETAGEMRAFQPRLPIVIISSDSLPGDISRCRDLRFCGHLLKPARSAAVLRQVVKALSNKQDCGPDADAGMPAARPAASYDRVRILAAEDSEDNRFLLEAYCAGTKYELTFAHDGQQAVKAYQAGYFDVVLMDVQMPEMDGLAATRTIRELEARSRRRRAPILAMTANALAEDVVRARDAGCDAHLAKPVSKKSLFAALEQWRMNPSAVEESGRFEEVDSVPLAAR